MTRGELEARVLDAERALASAPPDVSAQLRLTAHAEADALAQSADAQALPRPGQRLCRQGPGPADDRRTGAA